MSPECQNCGAHVTKRFVRVFAEAEADGIQRCQECHRRLSFTTQTDSRLTGRNWRAGP